MAKTRCSCSEAYYIDRQGRTRYAPGMHDCAYIARRNSLIPEAERRAHAATKAERGTLLHSQSWAMAFSAAMTELTSRNMEV